MPDEKGNVTLEITLPQEIYDRMKQLAEDGVQDRFPMPTNRQPTTAEEFVAELLIGGPNSFRPGVQPRSPTDEICEKHNVRFDEQGWKTGLRETSVPASILDSTHTGL